MLEKEFIGAIRSSVGAVDTASDEEVLAMALYHINNSRKRALPVSKDNEERGIGDLLQNFGSSEAMLAAFMIQILAKYSKEMVDEVINFLTELEKKRENDEPEDVPS